MSTATPLPLPLPTPENIAIVQNNLAAMQAFNDYVHNAASPYIANAYDLLTAPQPSDQDAAIALNILQGVFWAVSGATGGIEVAVSIKIALGAVSGFAASFLSGMCAYWTSGNLPSSLAQTFGDITTSYVKTQQQIDSKLHEYIVDPKSNWNVSFSYNGQTSTLCELASMTFPTESGKQQIDLGFAPMATAAINQLNRGIWIEALVKNYTIDIWNTDGSWCLPGTLTSPPDSYVKNYYNLHPSYFLKTLGYGLGSGCGACKQWQVQLYTINASNGDDITPQAAKYILIDSIPDNVINKDGLFTRFDLYTNLGIHDQVMDSNWVAGATLAGVPAPPPLSPAYLRAMTQGKTLTHLIATEGRESIQSRILSHAATDPYFAMDLHFRPRQTLEDFLGVKIAEAIDLRIVVEGPGTFGLVIPNPTFPPPSPATPSA